MDGYFFRDIIFNPVAGKINTIFYCRYLPIVIKRKCIIFKVAGIIGIGVAKAIYLPGAFSY